MTMRRHIIILVLLTLFVLSPVLWNHAVLYFSSPDIQYVMAKVNWVADGDLFTDPATGLPNFHPPIYHLFLSLFTRIGTDIEILLWLVSILNACLLILLTYFVVKKFTDPETALLTTLMFPFIVNFMGYGQLFLATAFWFSAPIYLMGLLLYFDPAAGRLKMAIAAALWGLAFIINPVYVFVIGFTFLYHLLIKKDYGGLMIMSAVFAVMIFPFAIQAVVVYGAGVGDTSTFSLWRGIPDQIWLKNFMTALISPVDNQILSWGSLLAVSLSSIGVLGLLRMRPIHPFPVIATAAYLFTAYHFSSQYAIRIHIFLSIFLVAGAIQWLRSLKLHRYVPIILITTIAILGSADNFYRIKNIYDTREEHYEFWKKTGAGLKINLGRFVSKGDFVLASEHTMRYFIMPFFMVHGLVAYRSPAYYQIDKDISEKMLADYDAFLECENISTIDSLCDLYNIRTCVGRLGEYDAVKGFETVALHWKRVYENYYFRVYQRP